MFSFIKKYFTFIIILLFSISYANDLHGLVLDMNTNEPLSGANIQIFDEEKYTFSDNSGYFTLKNIELSQIEIKVSFIGYKTQTLQLDMEKSSKNLQKFYLEPSLIQFEAVRVTIAKSEQTLSNTALPVALMEDKEINKKLANEVSSAIASEPGISVSGDGVWGKTVTIRGLSKNNVVMLVDGNRISTATNLAAALSMIDINDVDRIETIKSGASSLYGSGATGGVINIITKRANYSDYFYVKPTLKVGYNSVNNMHYESLNLMSGTKFWNAKVSLQKQRCAECRNTKWHFG